MGKRLIQQRRGKGGHVFRAPKKGNVAKYISVDEVQRNDALRGQVVDLVKDSGRNAVLAKVIFENGTEELVIAPEGLSVGQEVSYGKNADVVVGNVLPLAEIPEGCPIFAIEREPGDGGTMVKSAGSYALLVSKGKGGAQVKLPSGSTETINLDSRATVGSAAGGGRKEKPMVKAGSMFYAMRAKRHYYPTVRGVAMDAVSHPFGGEQHHPGKSKSTGRHAPPGRKVGAIAAKKTGRKKK